ncbi:MAG: class I SAM-dependent methyltransferase [Patescibacteria group bacterium]
MYNWKKYIKNTKHQEPRKLLVKALGFIKNKDVALDIGAGALNDSKLLQDTGFKKVYAIDIEENLELIKELSDQIVIFKKIAIENYVFSVDSLDLINAQFVLFLLKRNDLNKIINSIKSSLKLNGIFVGQFLGLNDSWANQSNVCVHSRLEIEELLSGLEIVYLKEEESNAVTALDESKHWHIFHFIARKI